MNTVLLIGAFTSEFVSQLQSDHEVIIAESPQTATSMVPAGGIIPSAIVVKNVPESEEEAIHRLVRRWPKAARVNVGPVEPWLDALGFCRYDGPTAHSQIKWAIFWAAAFHYLLA